MNVSGHIKPNYVEIHNKHCIISKMVASTAAKYTCTYTV